MSQQQIVKLTQEESAVLDNLPWSEEKGTTINYTKNGEPRSFYKKYRDIKYGDNTLEAQNIFARYGVVKVENFSGIWSYYAGKTGITQEAVNKKKSGGGTYSGVSSSSTYTKTSNVDWDKRNAEIKKGHEENMKAHEEFMIAHTEDMDAHTQNIQALNNLIGVISDLNNTMRETNRILEREKLK